MRLELECRRGQWDKLYMLRVSSCRQRCMFYSLYDTTSLSLTAKLAALQPGEATYGPLCLANTVIHVVCVNKYSLAKEVPIFPLSTSAFSFTQAMSGARQRLVAAGGDDPGLRPTGWLVGVTRLALDTFARRYDCLHSRGENDRGLLMSIFAEFQVRQMSVPDYILRALPVIILAASSRYLLCICSTLAMTLV